PTSPSGLMSVTIMDPAPVAAPGTLPGVTIVPARHTLESPSTSSARLSALGVPSVIPRSVKPAGTVTAAWAEAAATRPTTAPVTSALHRRHAPTAILDT